MPANVMLPPISEDAVHAQATVIIPCSCVIATNAIMKIEERVSPSSENIVRSIMSRIGPKLPRTIVKHCPNNSVFNIWMELENPSLTKGKIFPDKSSVVAMIKPIPVL